MDFDGQYKKYLDIFDDHLNNYLSSLNGGELSAAMKYSLESGGKRLRPVLALATADILGVDLNKILPFALAIELIHTSSLIHDDLPALDNDDMRRGKPSNHKAFGEALAVIAGDSLLNSAYEVLLSSLKTESEIRAAAFIAKCSGRCGMLGGQALDVASENESGENSESALIRIDKLKTCSLLTAPLVAAEILSGGSGESFYNFGENLGLLFQFTDDYLDAFGDSNTLGKSVGKDLKENKLTALSVYGAETLKQKISYLADNCRSFLIGLDNIGFLTALVTRLENREK